MTMQRDGDLARIEASQCDGDEPERITDADLTLMEVLARRVVADIHDNARVYAGVSHEETLAGNCLALVAALRELREALEPFATRANRYSDNIEYPADMRIEVPLADLRRAARILKEAHDGRDS